MVNTSVITGRGHAFPASALQADLWEHFFVKHYNESAIARRVFSHSRIRQRHSVANPIFDDVSQWSTAARMERYVTEALPLAKEAVTKALTAADVRPDDVGLFTVASCTGYATPDLAIMLAGALGMSASMQRTFLGHMGCYAALPGLGSVSDFVVARNRPALLLCIELTSLHVQPPTNDVEQMVAHALFSDAASAVVVTPGAEGKPGATGSIEVLDTAATTDVAEAGLMTWVVTDLGFRMGLSQKVPDVLARHVRGLVDDLLERNGLTIDDIDGWAAHPGGPRILDVIAEQLDLKPDALDPSRRVLAEHGNCSSPTVLLVLDEVLQTERVQSGSHVIALAFGPGLTLYATLLRVR